MVGIEFFYIKVELVSFDSLKGFLEMEIEFFVVLVFGLVFICCFLGYKEEEDGEGVGFGE